MTATTMEGQTSQAGRLGLLPLTALVVGSMIGGGVFSLPQNMAAGAGAGAVLIGWAITGLGMLALALVYCPASAPMRHFMGLEEWRVSVSS